MRANRNDSVVTPKTEGAGATAFGHELFEGHPDLLPVVPDLCEITGQSAQTIRALICSGKLPGCRIGRRLYVPKTRLIEYIEKRGGIDEK